MTSGASSVVVVVVVVVGEGNEGGETRVTLGRRKGTIGCGPCPLLAPPCRTGVPVYSNYNDGLSWQTAVGRVSIQVQQR